MSLNPRVQVSILGFVVLFEIALLAIISPDMANSIMPVLSLVAP